MARDRDEPLVPSWDGEPSGWADYSRRVRLCYQQTTSNKRYTLGPKLVLKLKGKAWDIASALNHDLLSGHDGTQYLLRFLRDRLGRLPIPDVGQHLDDLFVRQRRQVGVDLVTWANQLRETYRQVQRALARTGVSKKNAAIQTDYVGEPAVTQHTASEPQQEPPSPQAHASPTAEAQAEEVPDEHTPSVRSEQWSQWSRGTGTDGSGDLGRTGDRTENGAGMTGRRSPRSMMTRFSGKMRRPFLKCCQKKFWAGF